MRRPAFLAGASASLALLGGTSASLALLAFGARPAEATGGLDVGDGTTPHATMRVLLGRGNVAPPRQLDDWHFAWNGGTYRGSFTTVSLPDDGTGLVNLVPLDAYLYGVLSREVSAGWPRSAQEAQAIVARTYALRRIRPGKPYDVVASESDQRYGGIESETVEGRAAVDATAGTIVTYAGVPAQVAYGSCCGGHSADAAEVWGSDVPYLRGVVDPNCAGTPEYRWTLDLDAATLAAGLGASFAALGSLRAAALRDPDDSGRPKSVALDGAAGSIEVSTRTFRDSLGTGVVRSTLLRAIAVRDGGLHLEGSGRGHGVGLCQWGARMLGAAGSPAAAIVGFYFPGTALGTA